MLINEFPKSVTPGSRTVPSALTKTAGRAQNLRLSERFEPQRALEDDTVASVLLGRENPEGISTPANPFSFCTYTRESSGRREREPR